MTRHRHSLAKEGTTAGLLGAAVVALWFLATDLVRGEPFLTPSLLGQVLLFGNLTPDSTVVDPVSVLAYTAFHLGTFLLFGFIVAEFVHLAVRQPVFRFGLLVLFFAFEVVFVGVAVMFLEGTDGHFPIASILGANTLAALAMGSYLWRRHPALKRELARAPLGS